MLRSSLLGIESSQQSQQKSCNGFDTTKLNNNTTLQWHQNADKYRALHDINCNSARGKIHYSGHSNHKSLFGTCGKTVNSWQDGITQLFCHNTTYTHTTEISDNVTLVQSQSKANSMIRDHNHSLLLGTQGSMNHWQEVKHKILLQLKCTMHTQH